jgi:hypothetical protein
MADFHIRGRIEQVGADRFVSTIIANPAAGAERWVGNSLTETSQSYSSAMGALHRLSIEMGGRIRARGDEILSVDLDEGTR